MPIRAGPGGHSVHTAGGGADRRRVVEKTGGKPAAGIEVAAHSDRRGRGTRAEPADGHGGGRHVPSRQSVRWPHHRGPVGRPGQKPEWVADDVRVALTAGQTKRDVRMEITKGAFIEALIKETTGKPVEKVGVYFQRVGQDQGFGGPTDANGLARIRSFPAITVSPKSSGRATRRRKTWIG